MNQTESSVMETPSPEDSTDGKAADTSAASSPVTDEKVRVLLTVFDRELTCAQPVQDATPAHDGAAQEGGLLRFLNSYPLTRFTGPARPILRSLSGSTTISQDTMESRAPQNAAGTAVATLSAHSRGSATVRTYPLSTVIIVGLIAFLIGSLLRSMLSPADFVYVVGDLGNVEGVSAGWREIRRLLEIKYIVGGWDFQVALVRRQ
jgi:hypothetical protein